MFIMNNEDQTKSLINYKSGFHKNTANIYKLYWRKKGVWDIKQGKKIVPFKVILPHSRRLVYYDHFEAKLQGRIQDLISRDSEEKLIKP